jgi:glycogen debranching enzyme
MQIFHQDITKKEVCTKTVKDKDSPFFLLSNKLGGFSMFSSGASQSRFCGSYMFKDWQLYKVIEDIRLLGRETTELRNNFWNVERASQNALERFVHYKNALLYEVENFSGYANIWLDCRQIYDYSDNSRIYTISNEKNVIVVEYKKHCADGSYSLFLAIRGAHGYLKNEVWEKKHYPFDVCRNSQPSELFVYNAQKLAVDGRATFVLAYSDNKEEALRLADEVFNGYAQVTDGLKRYYSGLIGRSFNSANPEIGGETSIAYQCCLKAVDDLLMDVGESKGLFAGLPWFHQFWTRDEAISLKSLLAMNKTADFKYILFRQINAMLPDGMIPNRTPSSELSSADGVGWVFKRAADLFSAAMQLQGPTTVEGLELPDEELLFLETKLKHSISELLKKHTKEGLAYNQKLETWMDTYYGNDFREGFRIEIQALRLAMYKLMKDVYAANGNRLSGHYERLENAMREHVRNEFWKSPVLCDGVNDPTIRPNIFIAYYIYPELLSGNEWKKCFEHALKKLWLPWGGLSTIDKSSPLFTEEYTGENNRSYHRGDSWFYLNNMAALCMARLDKAYFKEYIGKIINASTEEVLYKGIIGHHAELSSAKELRAEASLSQLWSAAMYVEMIDEIYGAE